MELKIFYKSLSHDEREAYAAAIRTTVGYIGNHLIPTPRKVPRPEKLKLMADCSNGNVSRLEVLEHFYPWIEEAAA